MRELVSTWGPYLKDFYEYKRLSGFKYNSAESVIYQFDRYYKSLGINELKFTRDIVEPFLYICLLYTSDAADDLLCVDLDGRRILKKKK